MTSGTCNTFTRVAIPSEGHAGMLARVSQHFGKCQYFTIVEVTKSKPTETRILDNPPHRNCDAPVEFLREQGVSVLIVKGIGIRPLHACFKQGIDVFTGNGNTVGELITEFTANQLHRIGQDSLCTHS